MTKLTKRLIKKSNVQLAHATTLENFISIINEGSIKPVSQLSCSVHSNSCNENVSNVNESYENDMISKSNWDVGVVMIIDINENNLIPSYDYKEFTFPEKDDDGNEYYVNNDGKVIDENSLTWKETLDTFNECVYEDIIPINNIIYVKFVTNKNFKGIMDNFNKRLSLNEAIDFSDDIITYICEN